MTREQFRDIAVGDIVRPVNGHASEIYVVHSCRETTVTVVRVLYMTNPDEWDLIYKSNRTRVETR